MLTDQYGCPMSRVRVILLYIIVVVNIYNLLIVLSIEDCIARVPSSSSDVFETIKKVIVLETIASISVIIISANQSVSLKIFVIKFWLFGINFVALVLDLTFTSTTAFLLITESTSDDSLKMINLWGSVAPGIAYLLVGAVFTIYFAFKLCASFVLNPFGKIFTDEEFAADFANAVDIERNTSRNQNVSSEPPPSYSQCAIQSTPPPSYREVQIQK